MYQASVAYLVVSVISRVKLTGCGCLALQQYLVVAIRGTGVNSGTESGLANSTAYVAIQVEL